jgi:hypothetical protein
MGNFNDYVEVVISYNSVGLTRAGFGTPMILSATASFAERLRYYTSVTDVAVDFPVATSPERLAAAAMFAQTPRPSKIAIGRSALKPTQVYELSAVNPTGNASYTYKVRVAGTGFAETTVTFTSDATPTDAEYAAGMVAALNAVVGKNYTATGSASPITITGNAAGNWFSVEVLDVATQKIVMSHTNPGVATDLNAINAEQSDWYALYTLYNSEAYAIAAAGWVEAAEMKIYVCDTNESDAITTTAGGGDLIDTIKTNNYTATLGNYHPSPANMSGAALLGRCLPLEPGSVTFALKSLVGVTPVKLSATQRANLIAKRGNSYETVGNQINITFDGTVGSTSVGHLDLKRDVDWVKDDMTKAVFATLVAPDKFGYTDKDLVKLEAAIRGSLERAVRKNIFQRDANNFSLVIPKVADIATLDKQNRHVPDITWLAYPVGAVHKVKPITGRITF